VIATLHEKVQEQSIQIEELRDENYKLIKLKKLYFDMSKNVSLIQKQALTVNKFLSECLDQSHRISDKGEHYSF
jgi:hypothetical protein